MASTDARPVPRKNTAFRVTFPIFDAEGDFVTGATGLDSEVSIDGNAFADCTNEATEIATASGMYFLDLTAAEMNGDTVAVQVKTTSSGAKTTPLIFYPEEVGDFRADVVQLGGSTQSATDLKDFADDGYDPATNKVQGVVLVDTLTTYTGNTLQTGNVATLITTVGVAGAGLTAVAWNATWDAEVQSEVNDALVALNLDHWMAVAVTGGDVADNSALAMLASKSATADWDSYVNTTDSLEANRDNIGTTGAALTIAAVTGAVGSVTGAVGSVTGAVGSVTGAVGSVTGAVGSVTGAVGSVAGAVGSVTGNVGGNVTGSIGSLAAQAKTDVFTASLTTQMTESYAADGVAPTLAQCVLLVMQTVGEFAIVSTTLTAKKLDGSTTAATYTLDSATVPTSRTRAT